MKTLSGTSVFTLFNSVPHFNIPSVGPVWHQFRFTIGAPDAETKFKAAVTEAQKKDANARKYPSLYVRGTLLHSDFSNIGCAGFPRLSLEKLALSEIKLTPPLLP